MGREFHENFRNQKLLGEHGHWFWNMFVSVLHWSPRNDGGLFQGDCSADEAIVVFGAEVRKKK